MDQKTVDFYNQNAKEIFSRYESVDSPSASLFPHFFKQGGQILDIGCGSGRDLKELLTQGYNALGLEPSKNLIKESAGEKSLRGKIFQGSLPDDLPPPISEFPGSFDGILLSAVIMHIPEKELFDSALTLRSLLKPEGRIILSHCPERGDESGKNPNEDKGKRLFILRSSTQIKLLFEQLGFSEIGHFHRNDNLGRDEIKWETLIFEYSGRGQENQSG